MMKENLLLIITESHTQFFIQYYEKNKVKKYVIRK